MVMRARASGEAAAGTRSFAVPPISRTRDGRTRTAGFKLEFAGVSITQSAQIVQQVFGGDIERVSTFVHHVHAPAGKFAIELDAAILKDKHYEKPLRAIGFDPDR